MASPESITGLPTSYNSNFSLEVSNRFDERTLQEYLASLVHHPEATIKMSEGSKVSHPDFTKSHAISTKRSTNHKGTVVLEYKVDQDTEPERSEISYQAAVGFISNLKSGNVRIPNISSSFHYNLHEDDDNSEHDWEAVVSRISDAEYQKGIERQARKKLEEKTK